MCSTTEGPGAIQESPCFGTKPFDGPVHQLPVAQVAAPAEGDGARADAAQGHGHLEQVLAAVLAKEGVTGFHEDLLDLGGEESGP